eukprot:CAMPEP_0168749874 /NCGR_PEP_ID=MMETSP0724-20121128/16959_1 /TAXON_ID=265536 /ORGANISM="Amphiprora sp., Strain CCMP467" /LENGTH=51 /DNA_ID=CAMNT_0008797833 /DNA_START=517 /DNA_END=672 /DNA_ORIENTATION=+
MEVFHWFTTGVDGDDNSFNCNLDSEANNNNESDDPPLRGGSVVLRAAGHCG